MVVGSIPSWHWCQGDDPVIPTASRTQTQAAARSVLVRFKKLGARVVAKLKRTIHYTYPFWSAVIPVFYYPYRFSGGRIYLNIKESPMMLSRALGLYEVAKHEAVRAFLRPGDTFIDVGANKGDFSLLAARVVGPSGHVLAFEPAPENCRWIRKSIEVNGYQNVELHQLALADQSGEATLYLGRKSGWHTLVPDLPSRDKGSIRVTTRSLDDILVEVGMEEPIAMIKIDVEGAEMRVLQGARNTLRHNDRVVLAIDIHPDLGVDAREVCSYLEGFGFRVFEERPPFDRRANVWQSMESLVASRLGSLPTR